MDWETYYLPDIEHFVRARFVEDYDHVVEIEAFEGVAWCTGEDWPEDVPTRVQKRDWMCGIADVVGLDELDAAYRTLYGTIRSDGCSDLYWGQDEGYAHYCGMKNAVRVGRLMEHTYRIAYEFFLNTRENAYDGDWKLFSGE